MARRKNMQRRREILDNTFRLIRANGFDHVSLQMIAENSGISKSLLQSYYPHKARLMTDIVRNLFNTMWDQVEINYHAPKKNPFTRVDALIYTIATLGMTDKGLDRVITEVFTDQTSLDNWSPDAGRMDEVPQCFFRIQQLPGNPDWDCLYHYGGWPFVS